ncbi:GTP cyclohydrolase II RibA [Piscinibacter defluvii]|uniref:GTP cyclohydrolase II RibA n=1 Tax=Piscinibacter defluvii TaxID=1796922 RepID=UPI001F0B762E|nr:GTP cyclohydrolase II RibA [Piscinibacter defluvii]
MPSPIITLPTQFGDFSVEVGDASTDVPPWVLIYRKPWEAVPFLRIHSSCLFSESLHSIDCDCALQLAKSLETISKVGGAVVYLYQEGRGLGLFQKVVAISKQQELGVETAEAYRQLGYELDPRQYSVVAEALESIEFPKCVRLATNNPRKVAALEAVGYRVAERAQMQIDVSEHVSDYLQSKVRGLGHYERD